MGLTTSVVLRICSVSSGMRASSCLHSLSYSCCTRAIKFVGIALRVFVLIASTTTAEFEGAEVAAALRPKTRVGLALLSSKDKLVDGLLGTEFASSNAPEPPPMIALPFLGD